MADYKRLKNRPAGPVFSDSNPRRPWWWDLGQEHKRAKIKEVIPPAMDEEMVRKPKEGVPQRQEGIIKASWRDEAVPLVGQRDSPKESKGEAKDAAIRQLELLVKERGEHPDPATLEREIARAAALADVPIPPQESGWKREAVPVQEGEGWRQQAEPVEEPGAISAVAEAYLGLTTGAAKIGLGVVEQPAAGLGAVGEMAVHGITALGRAILPRIPFLPEVAERVSEAVLNSNFETRILHGASPRAVEEAMAERERQRAGLKDAVAGMRIARTMPISEQFIQEYEAAGLETTGFQGGINWLFKQMKPETETGQFIFNKIGEWFEAGLSSIGDQVFEHGLMGSMPGPAARLISEIAEKPFSEIRAGQAALAKGAAAIAAIGAPGKVAAERTARKTSEKLGAELQKDANKFMQDHFPNTWREIENAKVGKVSTGMPGGVEVNVIGNIRNTLENLGVPSELYADRSLSELVKMTIETADKGGEISPSMRSAITDATVGQVAFLKSLEDAMTPKALPAPSPIPGIVEVSPSGVAATPKQRVRERKRFAKLTNEQRAEILGIGPMGILRTRADAYRRALREAGAEAEGTPAVAAARHSVEEAWEQAFPLGKVKPGVSKAQRAKVLQEWLEQGAPYDSWSVLASQVYNRPPRNKIAPPGGMRQAGVVSLEGLEGIPEGGKEAARAAKAAAIVPVRSLDERIKSGDLSERQIMSELENLSEAVGGGLSISEVRERIGNPNLAERRILAERLGEIAERDILDSGWDENVVRGAAKISSDLLSSSWQSKQAGVVSLKGLEGMPEEARRAAQLARTAAVTPRGGDTAGFDRVEKAWSTIEKTRAEQDRYTLSRVASAFRDKVADHQGTLKRTLEGAGDLGIEVKDRLSVLSAATMRGKFMYEQHAKPIFEGLSGEELRNLNKLVSARNMVEARRRNPKYLGRDGITPADMEGWVRTLARQNPRQFQRLEAAADKVFQVYRAQLDELVEAGLLSKENYGRIVRADSVSDISRILDPEIPGVADLISGQPATASGIPYMRLGKKAPALMSARQLLSETIGRAQNQIMRNDAAKALYKLAKSNPDLDFIQAVPVDSWTREGKAKGIYVPEGYMKISAWEGGRENVLLIDHALGEQWYHRPPAMDSIVADISRIISGSSLVRSLATSYNFLFPVAGFPMDAVHLYFAAGREYSAHLPIFLGQFSVDLSAVWLDAVQRGPRFQQAMKEGMGFDFMTHQGRDLIIHTSSLEKQFNPKMETIKKTLSWVNETQEIAVRLAHRERLIKSGLPSWQATARARERLDFSQGGVISKFADVFIPYANVAVQGWRAVLSEGARNPKRAAGKLTWATGAILGLTYISMMQDMEAWLDIPDRDKINGIPIVIPELTYIDSAGNKRVGYVNIRSDNTVAPLHALVVSTLQKTMTGKGPTRMMTETMASLPSILQFGTWPVPIIEAFYRYATDFDIRSDAPIWRGTKVPPELEFKGPAYQQPTSEIMKQIGELTNLSPERLSSALRALLPSNPYVGAIQGLVNMALGVQDPSVRTKGTMEMLAQNQALRRVIKFTHPATREMEAIDKAEREKGGKMKPLLDTTDEYVVKYNQGDVGTKDFEAWLKTQPPEYQERLAKRFKTGAAFEYVMKTMRASEEIPSRSWWMGLSNLDSEVRADLFFDRWISAPVEERKRMEAVAAGLTKFGTGFRSDEFNRYFARRLQQYSSDQR